MGSGRNASGEADETGAFFAGGAGGDEGALFEDAKGGCVAGGDFSFHAGHAGLAKGPGQDGGVILASAMVGRKGSGPISSVVDKGFFDWKDGDAAAVKIHLDANQ